MDGVLQERLASGQILQIASDFRDTPYGLQLELLKIREVVEQDAEDGFSAEMCVPRSRRDPEAMFVDLMEIVQRIEEDSIRSIVEWLLTTNKSLWLRLPAEASNHHVYAGGLLEHTLQVAETVWFLAERYADHYAEMQPPFSKDVAIAASILHDVGKLSEIVPTPCGAELSAEGDLLGHVVLGRDFIRDAARVCGERGIEVSRESILRLEHAIIAHHRLPEFGAPKPPMTPEALLVHYANEIDVKFAMMASIYEQDSEEGHMTGKRNILQQKLFKGLGEEAARTKTLEAAASSKLEGEKA